MEKIDLKKIRGSWMEMDEGVAINGGDDTIKSIRLVAEKVNEIIDFLYTPVSDKGGQERLVEVRDFVNREDSVKEGVVYMHENPYYQTDHFHCWQQGKAPACGLPLETHKICCLCAIKNRKRTYPEG